MLIIMAMVQDPGSVIACRTARPGSLPRLARTLPVPGRFEERDRLQKTDITPEICREFMLLAEFLTHHVRQDDLHDVQCMLLWTEWVRIFLRETRRFPVAILEDEFRLAIMDHLGVGIADDGIRGPVYPGVRFVP